MGSEFRSMIWANDYEVTNVSWDYRSHFVRSVVPLSLEPFFQRKVDLKRPLYKWPLMFAFSSS